MKYSLLICFTSGVLSFLSPCFISLLPMYIMYLTGSNILIKNKLKIFINSLFFCLGFSLVFILLGSGVNLISQLLLKNKILFTKISGLIIILFGIQLSEIFNINFLNKSYKKKFLPKKTGILNSFLLGFVFSLGWTPCFGPVLGSILIYASSTGDVLMGIKMLSSYSIGMSLPFLVSSLFIIYLEKFISNHEKLILFIPKISGFLLIIFGILMFFNKLSILNILR